MYTSDYQKAIKYSFVRPNPDLNSLIRSIRQTPHDNTGHGILADYLDEHFPDAEAISHLIRKHTGNDINSTEVENDYTPKIETEHNNYDSAFLGRLEPFHLDISFAPSRQHVSDGGKINGSKAIIHAHLDGAHTDAKDDDAPLSYNFEFPLAHGKELKEFKKHLQNTGDIGKHIADRIKHFGV